MGIRRSRMQPSAVDVGPSMRGHTGHESAPPVSENSIQSTKHTDDYHLLRPLVSLRGSEDGCLNRNRRGRAAGPRCELAL